MVIYSAVKRFCRIRWSLEIYLRGKQEIFADLHCMLKGEGSLLRPKAVVFLDDIATRR